MVLDHHEALDNKLVAIRNAATPAARHQALHEFERLFAGHSIPEEMVVYPAGSQVGEKMSANMGYTEHQAAKMQIAALEVMDPMSEAFLDKLGHLEGAVRHHIHEEEDKRFVELHERASPAEIERIAVRYREEFDRYIGQSSEGARRTSAEPRPFIAGP